MPDAIFAHPRLVAVYDALEPDRRDLDAYVQLVDALGARRVVDLGCGTGVLARRLAGDGLIVTGVDPAAASIEWARTRPGGDGVDWVVGDARAIPAGTGADAVLMTGNAAQAVHDPDEWAATLAAVREALRPGGAFVVETRDPARRAWAGWTPVGTAVRAEVPGIGTVRRWTEGVTESLPLVSFTTVTVFEADGERIESTSTLRFREREEMTSDLAAAGLDVHEVRDAPDRPGLELVFVAVRR